jgi:hypothetical protein
LFRPTVDVDGRVRSPMRRRLSALLAAALVAGGVLLTAQPAAADTPCLFDNLSEVPFGPSKVNVGLSPVTKEFTVATHDYYECSVSYWSINVYRSAINGYTPLVYVNSTLPSFTFRPRSLDNTDAGSYDVDANVHNGDNVSTMATFTDSFLLQRRTAISLFDATPDRVTAGQPIAISALLRSADWDRNTYVPLRYASVYVQFRPVGSYWRRVKTVKSSSTGWVKTTVTAKVDGSYRLYYLGDLRFSGKISPADYVDVR